MSYSAITYKDSYKIYQTPLDDLTFKNAIELTELPYHYEKIDSIENYSAIFPVSQFILNNNKYYLNIGEANEQ